ncbi:MULTISPECIES: hypothetical protein [unclassified Streptomyces]|uniref:hypothetical protein n=1 Tax=unclassified Streptomyces TaxID=2593676 RepID=UPI00081F08E2|nr:hypothetical protein [Streptomyces sp. SID4917]SCG00589.1 hypothetical protein GA0115259_107007 [Streptomyces sp. MnatMP-M17]
MRADSAPQVPDAAAAYYRSLLAERTVLIVLDNAATAAQVRPPLPGGTRCLTVVTNRSRLSGLAVRGWSASADHFVTDTTDAAPDTVSPDQAS